MDTYAKRLAAAIIEVMNEDYNNSEVGFYVVFPKGYAGEIDDINISGKGNLESVVERALIRASERTKGLID